MIVSSRGERLWRSSRLISVRCRPHRSPSASWERPRRMRCARRFAAKRSWAASIARTLIVEQTKRLQTKGYEPRSGEIVSQSYADVADVVALLTFFVKFLAVG